MVPGFEAELRASGDLGVRYAVFIGKQNIGEKQLDYPSGMNDIRIAPVLHGRKGGIFQTILGVALIVIGAIMWEYGGTTIAAYGVSLMGMGVGVTLGGIAQLISRQPQMPQNLQSYNFNGAENTTYQGGPVPLLYGRMRVGSTVISEGLLAKDGTAQLVGGNYVPTVTAGN